MLVLSRKVGERIRIGDDIELVVLELGRDQVRLGITAPRSVAVHRQEVYTEIAEANRMASGEPPTVAAAAAASFTGLPGRDRAGA